MRGTTLKRLAGERRLMAALALFGLALVAAAATVAAARPSSASYLDAHPQTARALPQPGGRWLATAAAAQAHATQPGARVRKQMPLPARIAIPAIAASAPLIPLGWNPDHTIQVPKSFAVAGWFRPGPEPGEQGAAVILGHVDSRSGPGVFYHLRAVHRGDRIRVMLKTRKTLTFVVTGTKEVPKRHFPTKLVYAHTGWPRLRVITCDGSFDRATGHYVDNFIVFASLIRPSAS